MKYLFLLLFIVVSAAAHAKEGFPVGCQAVAVQQESVMLKAKKPMLVLVHNLSRGDLWITHPVSDPSASAGWSSRLEAGNWSALAVDKESFELSCIESKPGHEQQVPCVGVIAVCEWSTVKLPTDAVGTFWAGENMTLETLTAHLGGRGYSVPAAS